MVEASDRWIDMTLYAMSAPTGPAAPLLQHPSRGADLPDDRAPGQSCSPSLGQDAWPGRAEPSLWMVHPQAAGAGCEGPMPLTDASDPDLLRFATAATLAGGAGTLGGSLAFARQLADQLERPVLAIHTGLDWRDRLRSSLPSALRWMAWPPAGLTAPPSPPPADRMASALDCLQRLLDAPGFRPRMMAAHGAGAAVLAHALRLHADRVAAGGDLPARDTLPVLLLASAHAVPAHFRRVRHVVGALDPWAWPWFGRSSSPALAGLQWRPGCGAGVASGWAWGAPLDLAAELRAFAGEV